MKTLQRVVGMTAVAASLLAALPALAQSPGPAPVPPPPRLQAPAPAQVLSAIAEAYHQAQIQYEPLFATFLGDHSVNDRLSRALLPAERARHFGRLRSLQQDLATVDRSKLDAAGQLDFDLLSQALRQSLALESFPEQYLPMNQMVSVPVYLANWASGQGPQPLQTADDYEAFRKRLLALPEWTESAIAAMRAGIKAGVVHNRHIVLGLQAQIQRLAAGEVEKSPFYAGALKPPAAFSEMERRRISLLYKDAAGKAQQAMQKLAQFLSSEYLPAARTEAGYGSLPDGQAWYRVLAMQNTTTELTPNEIHQIGLNEMARIDEELRKIGAQLGYAGKPAGLFAWLASQPKQRPFQTEEQVLQAYRDIYQRVQSRIGPLFKSLPKSPLEIRPEPELSKQAASDHYTIGSADLSRPGVFWAVIHDPRDYATTRMVSLFLHEGAPGHHFQLSRQAELTSLPKFRKFNGNNAYIEGWALYAETLGQEMGLYANDPDAYAGALMGDLTRAARLVVDTGLHAKGWTREQTIAFLMERVGNTEAQARNATERYMAWPGQALGYKIGALKIMELRKLAERELGARFQLADFHDEVLRHGPLPLAVLESQIKAWISRVKAG